MNPMTITGLAEMASIIPAQLGFEPQESLVACFLRGDQVVVSARMDLDEVTARAEGAMMHLADVGRNRAGADRVLLMAFSSEMPEALDLLLQLDTLMPMPVEGLLAISPAGEWIDGEMNRGQIDRYSLAHTTMVANGACVMGSREEFAASVAGPGPDTHPELVDNVRRVLETHKDDPREFLGRLLVQGLAKEQLDATNAITMAALCMIPRVRDVFYREMSMATAAADERLWRQVVAETPDCLASGALSMLGIAGWLGGNGSLLSVCYERAEELDPDSGAVMIMGDILDNAVPPTAWADLIKP